MSSYPTTTDIEMRWRAAGSGVCVIVEGQTEQDDAWFYNYWFNDQARDITFFCPYPPADLRHLVTAILTHAHS